MITDVAGENLKICGDYYKFIHIFALPLLPQAAPFYSYLLSTINYLHIWWCPLQCIWFVLFTDYLHLAPLNLFYKKHLLCILSFCICITVLQRSYSLPPPSLQVYTVIVIHLLANQKLCDRMCFFHKKLLTKVDPQTLISQPAWKQNFTISQHWQQSSCHCSAAWTFKVQVAHCLARSAPENTL